MSAKSDSYEPWLRQHPPKQQRVNMSGRGHPDIQDIKRLYASRCPRHLLFFYGQLGFVERYRPQPVAFGLKQIC